MDFTSDFSPFSLWLYLRIDSKIGKYVLAYLSQAAFSACSLAQNSQKCTSKRKPAVYPKKCIVVLY